MSHEEHIAEVLSDSFEKLRSNLENLRSMLQDLVLAVPAVPDLDKLTKALGEAIPEPRSEPAEPEEQAPVAATPSLNNRLLYHMAGIEYANTQAEVLNQLMKGLEEHAARGALFVVKNENAQVWSAFGFENAEEAKRWKTTMDSDPLLRTIASSRSRMLLDNTVPGFIPDHSQVVRSLLSPLILKGKVLGFFYADSGADGNLDHYGIDILMRTASLVIDIFPLHPKRNPLPPVLEQQPIITSDLPAPAQEEDEDAVLFEDTGTLSSQAEEEEDLPGAQTVMAEIPTEEESLSASEPEGETQEEPEPEAEAEEKPEEEPETMPADTGAHRLEPVELESGEYEQPEAAEPEEEESAAETSPDVEAAIPADEAEVPVPAGEEKLHEDAQRFARLLVQEIALYHPNEVEQGKRDGTLFNLLREDIERSREAYENRFQKPSVRDRAYFDKSLVKYLADGDPSLLGM